MARMGSLQLCAADDDVRMWVGMQRVRVHAAHARPRECLEQQAAPMHFMSKTCATAALTY